MAKHLPSVEYPIRSVGSYPQIYVMTEDEKNLKISFYKVKDKPGFSLILPRIDAKLLSKRINQCLEESK